ncbi:uncharacterized protein HD556DRAFT_1447873 [Suillus plorans]|uniref:Uncharacterized protein n=1 Tax=Suillus plorans TaxID=116603 RepID=A0A9P7DCH6_9AGAM|nr:uncharacterized protein HD556DRAFT_1447873 [Suillus plorans]KAG1788475.1 hypothetical protein HD556DRAFT_1447873 [Suillus plorans]
MDPPTTTTRRKTNYEKGEHYLQLTLETLDELASLSEHKCLSENQKASFAEAYRDGRILSQEMIEIRDKLLTQKKSFCKFLVNLFIRQSSTKHFYKVTHENYSSIRRTSDDLNRILVSEIDALLVSGNLRVSAQGNEAVNKESLPRNVVEDNPGRREDSLLDEEDGSIRSPCDVVEGNHSAKGLSSNKDTQDIHLDVHTKQGVQEAFTILDRLGIKFDDDGGGGCGGCGGCGGDDDDGSATIIPLHSQSRAPSPSPSLFTINIFINQSMVSFDSELTGATLNVGANELEGVGFGYR